LLRNETSYKRYGNLLLKIDYGAFCWCYHVFKWLALLIRGMTWKLTAIMDHRWIFLLQLSTEVLITALKCENWCITSSYCVIDDNVGDFLKQYRKFSLDYRRKCLKSCVTCDYCADYWVINGWVGILCWKLCDVYSL